MRATSFAIALVAQAQMAEKFRMSITYPAPQKANLCPQPTLAPTPKLRAQAAVGEAIAAFKSMARNAGMIVLFLIMMSSKNLSGMDQYFWLVLSSLVIAFLSLTFAAYDFTPASKRAKYLSGIDEGRRGPDVHNWLLWAAFVGTFVMGWGILFGHKALGLPIGDATALSCYILITAQLVAILMDMRRGVKLLRFAQAQLLFNEVS
jgi:hypothetical protein